MLCHFYIHKYKHLGEEVALNRARSILAYLKPHGSFDSEALELWAAVHKRLFEINADRGVLEEAIFALEHGFFIKSDSIHKPPALPVRIYKVLPLPRGHA